MAGLEVRLPVGKSFGLIRLLLLQQLEALATVVGVEREQLQEMLPPPGVGMKLEPIKVVWGLLC